MADLAAFDFDGTLTSGGSVFGFLTALVGRGPVVAAAAALSPQLAHAAIVGGAAADRAKERLFGRVMAGVPLDHVDKVAARYGRDHVDGRLRPDVGNRLDWHRGRADTVVIVSASPEAYVAAAGGRLGADGVIATRLAVGGDGTLTGRYEGANCRGDEKLRRLRQWIEDSGTCPERVWAYGNSRGDLSILRSADVGVNVGRLGRMGRLKAFPTLEQVQRATPEPRAG
ncbi:MAG TPA: HAD-IB family hydrolase [Acidimicrobiales bacterium]|nr:HAD-IB family hydrolase [Acidimicrobiales bacterium]